MNTETYSASKDPEVRAIIERGRQLAASIPDLRGGRLVSLFLFAAFQAEWTDTQNAISGPAAEIVRLLDQQMTPEAQFASTLEVTFEAFNKKTQLVKAIMAMTLAGERIEEANPKLKEAPPAGNA